MKIKHNKKRNTAFVYEALVREITVAVLKNEQEKKEKALKIIQKHFKPNSVLRKHLECYRSLYENQGLEEKTCEKIMVEAKIGSRLLDAHGLFVGHSDLIDDVNKELSPQVFNNFVPNYKTLASIYQIFSTEETPKNSVILETNLIKDMMKSKDTKESMDTIDDLTLRSFIGKFNEKYGDSLLEEQKTLLTLYISSFSDNCLSLKSYLNEEIHRIKMCIEDGKSLKEISEDQEMIEKSEKVIKIIENFKDSQVDEKVLIKVLKMQQLVKEISKDVDND